MAVREGEIRLTDLIDVESLQKIQDAFSEMTGIASFITCLLYTSDAADEL